MIDATALIQSFLDAELAVARANWTEQDDSRFYEILSHFTRHVAKHARLLMVPEGRGMAEIEEFEPAEVERQLGMLRRRTLFATASWKHPAEGLVITALVDRPDPQLESRPTQRMHLLMDREPPQFVAHETTCSTCRATGRRGDVRCEDCAGRGWTGYRGNLDLGPIVNLGQANLHVPRERVEERDQPLLAALGL